MAAQPAVWGASWRNKLQALLVIAIAIVGLVTALVLLYIEWHAAAEVSAYKSAGVCAAPAGALGSDACRYEGQATIVSTRRDIRLYAVVAFASIPGRSFTTSWPTQTEPDLALLSPGATVDAEIWNNKITKLGGIRTVDGPEDLPNLWQASAFLLVTGLPLLVWGGLLARTAWRDQANVVSMVADSKLAKLSARPRNAILATIFLILGTPVSVYLMFNSHSGLEFVYRVITAIVLLAIGLSFAWTAWRNQ